MLNLLPVFLGEPARKLPELFGLLTDSMSEVLGRMRSAFPDLDLIVWHGDPETFHFSYVGGDAERILGYPGQRWVDEHSFWADVVVTPEDRDDAIAYCALATGRRRDHSFVYRARHADGHEVVLLDVVRVYSRGAVAVGLRGVMFDVTRLRDSVIPPDLRIPTVMELQEMTV